MSTTQTLSAVDLRPFEKLGRFQTDWLDAKHHFSFGSYYDPARMGVGKLRVWNNDVIQPQTGFDPHPHRDMEIMTYVLKGAITHEDNLGNEGRTEAGQVQVMSAGTGIVHAEYNREDIETEIFQIWVEPNEKGHAPRWDTKDFPRGDNTGQLVPLASGQDAYPDALRIHQDATLFAASLHKAQTVRHVLAAGRAAYLAVPKGHVEVNGALIATRDGAAITEPGMIEITGADAAEVILVDVPA